jgi:indolepyruvate ferredoxin oxidoreductase
MVAASKDAMGLSLSSRTVAAVNTDVQPTGNFARNPDWQGASEELLRQVATRLKRAEMQSLPMYW